MAKCQNLKHRNAFFHKVVIFWQNENDHVDNKIKIYKCTNFKAFNFEILKQTKKFHSDFNEIYIEYQVNC